MASEAREVEEIVEEAPTSAQLPPGLRVAPKECAVRAAETRYVCNPRLHSHELLNVRNREHLELQPHASKRRGQQPRG